MRNEAVTEEVELRQESYGVYCIETAVNEFLRHQEGIGRAASTRESYRVNLGYWQRYLVGRDITTLAELTPQVMAGFQAWVYEYRTRYGRPLTVAGQIGVLNSLHVFCGYLLKTGRLLNNPSEVIRLPKQPQRLPAVILSTGELKRLLAQPDPATVLGFRDRTMYEVLYSTGLRIGELIRLRVPDLALADGTLFIHEGKGRKDRVVPVGATACRYLAEYLQRVRPLLLRNSAPPRETSSDTLFLSRLGRALDNSGVEAKLQLYAARAKLKKRLTVHVFRHTLATGMLRHGADIRQIQELLGHGSLRTTQLYTHIVKGELKRVQAECHPREQTELPEGFTAYRGRTYLTDADRRKDARGQAHSTRSGQAHSTGAGQETDEP